MKQLYQIRQCTAPACRLRFPARTEQLPTLGCPVCGALTDVCVQFRGNGERVGMPFPEAFGQLGCDSCSHDELADGSGPSNINPPVAAPFVVIVDNVRSVHNVGSIFRSADGAGVTHLFLCGITPTPTNPKLAKTALGAEVAVPWTQYNNSLDCVARLRRESYHLWALEEHTMATSIFSAPLPSESLALIIGNELTGIDPALLAAADKIVALPMYGTKRSLNVATAFGAAAVLLAHRYHQLKSAT